MLKRKMGGRDEANCRAKASCGERERKKKRGKRLNAGAVSMGSLSLLWKNPLSVLYGGSGFQQPAATTAGVTCFCPFVPVFSSSLVFRFQPIGCWLLSHSLFDFPVQPFGGCVERPDDVRLQDWCKAVVSWQESWRTATSVEHLRTLNRLARGERYS